MQRNSRWARSAVAAALVALGSTALTGPASAQTPEERTENEVRAMEAQAMEYIGNQEWTRAASLFRRAADLREPGDPAAINDLVRAAQLSFYRGDEGRAIRDFESAGRRAMAIGDVLVAAYAFVDAAWIAERGGHSRRALDLLARARLLSNSPLLPEDDRRHLRRRWEVTTGGP